MNPHSLTHTKLIFIMTEQQNDNSHISYDANLNISSLFINHHFTSQHTNSTSYPHTNNNLTELLNTQSTNNTSFPLNYSSNTHTTSLHNGFDQLNLQEYNNIFPPTSIRSLGHVTTKNSLKLFETSPTLPNNHGSQPVNTVQYITNKRYHKAQ